MTNQESIECTCRVEIEECCSQCTGERIIHGPCHSPGPEVWARLAEVEGLLLEVQAFSQRNSTFPSNSSCECGGEPHPDGPCSGKYCSCEAYTIQDGYELGQKIDSLLSTQKEKV